jgi:polynucleotide 5'-hydroxyl-kinase GRC3/NOL9
MADSELRLRRVPCRFALAKARKTRPKLILSRRARRRLGTQRRGERRRLRRRRRLLQAQAAGADYREGTGQGSRAEAARKPKAAAPSPARSVRAAVPVPLVRQVGPGRALLLLPAEEVGHARGVRGLSTETQPRELPE